MTTKYGEASTRLASKNPHFFFLTDYTQFPPFLFCLPPAFFFLYYFFLIGLFDSMDAAFFSFWVVVPCMYCIIVNVVSSCTGSVASSDEGASPPRPAYC
jgi:hypothetical protein